MSRAILGRLDELLSLEKREKDHVNAEVDDAVSTDENALDAVSYTHLDVYKRQTRKRRNAPPWRQP